ncbi:MAG: S8 family peptidase [Armatimonadetes bacterium]|nr:S8 family peptidase [Armatimonadota bacterium]
MKINHLSRVPLKYRKEVDSKGFIPVIVQSEDSKLLNELKKVCVKVCKTNQIKHNLSIINGFSALIDPKGKWPFSNPKLPRDKFTISLDQKVFALPLTHHYENEDKFIKPRLDIARGVLNMPEVWKIATGKGRVGAVIDTGIDTTHQDLKAQVKDFYDVVGGKKESYDDEGHGSHVSSIVAGTGEASGGLYKGIAPDAKLVGVKVLDKNGSGSYSDVIKGVEWIVAKNKEYPIDVINMSLGGTPQGSYKDDPLCQALEVAEKEGIAVIAAAGNEGPFKSTISTPAYAPFVNAVGAYDDNGTVNRKDDKIAYFSSRGPTKFDKLVKPDNSAPGVNIMAAKAGSINGYVALDGTSMASPMVAGAVLLLKQVKPDIMPNLTKELLKKTADPLPKVDENIQGKGLVDPLEALTA